MPSQSDKQIARLVRRQTMDSKLPGTKPPGSMNRHKSFPLDPGTRRRRQRKAAR